MASTEYEITRGTHTTDFHEYTQDFTNVSSSFFFVYTSWWLIFHVRLCLALFVHGANSEANKRELNNNTAEQRME